MRLLEYALYGYLFSFLLVLIFFFIDWTKKRTLKHYEKISILIPCYNDGESIELTIQSVYQSYPPDHFQLIVINDKSTDDSLQKLHTLQKKYGFTLKDNEKNLGKSNTLNTASEWADYDKLLILDADVIITPKHIHDMLARMQKNPRIAAVSCPYIPYNTGFFPIMQDMEYVMLDLVQGSYNTFGAIALWGGCFIVQKEAFQKVGKFSSRMMTEDMDLAFKLNKAGYKVEQSFHRVSTFVPDTFKTRYKQKIRRNSGGAHCFFKYPQIWMKNPLHVIMIFSFNILIVSLLVQSLRNYDLLSIIFAQPDIRRAFWIVFSPRYRLQFLIEKTSFSLFSLPYVIPLLTHRKKARKLLLIIPYSIIYIPLYTLV
jgi:cellulose synthase/poly-beta-1,6-N-acetylglucosamine synthase-like glycosyltransferase